jgi:hypothetical protein
MSILSTNANYGGKIADYQTNIKQFYVSPTGIVAWIYKKLSNGLILQTPNDNTKSVLINNDLIVTGTIFNSSDERLKKNIKYITNSEFNIDILSLNPVYFNYKNDNKEKTHYGFLAQDVEKIFPEFVENNNISGYKSVNYQEFIPLILNKMKTMQNEIDELKNSK